MAGELNDVPLNSDHEETINEMENPVAVEADELREMDRKLAKLEVLEKLQEREQRIIDRAS